MFKIHFPWNNLGCFGLSIGSLYVDVYRTDSFPWIALFANWGGSKWRLSYRKGLRRTES